MRQSSVHLGLIQHLLSTTCKKKTDQQSATEVSFITLVNFKVCIIKINYRANHVCTSYDEQHRLYTTIDGNQGRLRYKQ